MGLNFGPQVNIAAGTFAATGAPGVTIPIVNPRGKPTFARTLTIRNTGANPITVFFPGRAEPISGTGSVADISTTIAAGVSQQFEGAIWQLNLRGTSGQTYEVMGTVAG